MTAEQAVELYPGRTVPASYAQEVVEAVAAAPPLSEGQRDVTRFLLEGNRGQSLMRNFPLLIPGKSQPHSQCGKGNKPGTDKNEQYARRAGGHD